MSVRKNIVTSVSKGDGQHIQSVVRKIRKLFGSAAESVCLPNLCATSPKITCYNCRERDFLFQEIMMIHLIVNIVVEKFPVWISWITKDILQFARKRHGIESKWNKIIEMCSTLDFYKGVMNQLFSNGNYTYARLYVFFIFTEKVCREHPEMFEEIQKVYVDFIRQI